MLRKSLALFLVVLSANYPVLAAAAAPRIPGFYGKITTRPSVNQLPTGGNVRQGATIDPNSGPNQMTIWQNQSKAVIDWDTFNIGEKATVWFKQGNWKVDANGKPVLDGKGNQIWVPQKDYAALNFIHDANPTQIYGTLTADGKVYLINQNGILFGPGSQVNVHTLVASSLKPYTIHNGAATTDESAVTEDYLNGNWAYQFQADAGSTPGAVSNHGTIEAGTYDPATGKLTDAGAVFLVGPTVENNGTIDALYGQIGLVAGTKVDIAPDPNAGKPGSIVRWALVANVQENPGLAWNMASGRLTADGGIVGMYGGTVQQDGIIRSVTTIKRNGQIELLARDRIVTGAGSTTATPVTTATDTVNSSSDFTRSSILLSGLDGAAGRIELNGAITAPGGTVTVSALDRVYLAGNSSIDVSGVWNDKDARDNTVTTQYTSVVLRDAFQQKNGVVKGANVTADSLTGASFGDISGSLGSRDMTAMERSTAGGEINISAVNGDIITRSGSLLDFSGGGTRYRTGNIETTKLLAGNRVYDISTAPQNIAYDRVLGSYKLTSKKYGVVDDFSGLYYGGGSRLNDLASNFIEGSSAGALRLNARSLTLDGQMNGGVTKGVYQTLAADPVDKIGRQTASGLQEPVGGTLIIGKSPGTDETTRDLVTTRVVVAADATPLDDSKFSKDSQPDPNKTTTLSARAINDAGLSNLQIYANSSITTEQDASIRLQAAGSLTAESRRIEHNGKISVPAGSVTFITEQNKTNFDPTDPNYAFETPTNPKETPYNSNIYLARDSSISVAGKKTDNLLAGKGEGFALATGRRNGGTITIEDQTLNDLGVPNIVNRGVIVNRGALLDVSGGYQVNPNGSMSGGDAGAITLQGSTLIANGDLRGLSLPGQKGGEITLHADNVAVQATVPELDRDFSATTSLPASLQGNLLLAGDRFDTTGFASINLKSTNDLTVASGVTLKPSLNQLKPPTLTADRLTSGYFVNSSTRILAADGTVSLGNIGPSAVRLTAGQLLDGAPAGPNSNTARVVVSAGATVRAAPEGEITLTGPSVVMDGLLNAPAGNVTLRATNSDVLVGGYINAAGYNRPDVTPVGSGMTAGYSPKDGGSVTLSAAGDVTLEQGAVVNVSGTTPVTTHQGTGNSVPVAVTLASDPGTVNISFKGKFTNSGAMTAKRYQEGLRGGTLSIVKTDAANGLEVSDPLINDALSSGFDALSFKSSREIAFNGTMDRSIGRKLTLDAPEIRGSGSDQISLASPWIRLVNSSDRQPVTTPDAGAAILTLKGSGLDKTSPGFIDVEGDVALSGFKDVRLEASRDIRLADSKYTTPNTFWSGRFATSGDLTLKADRIYPTMTISTDLDGKVTTTPSDFTISSGGKVTTLAGDDSTNRPVYSAGGKLTINAAGGIEHKGAIYAPLGEIVLNSADQRVYLAPGSVLSTAGSAVVDYGFVDENGVLRTVDKSANADPNGIKVDSAPQKSITLNGKEVIVRDGATIDVSGGGGVMAYRFQPGVEGSVNPLTVKGRYVIVPGNLYDLPGDAVYLKGGDGLAAGVYSILPAAYAFLPGAMVLTDLGSTAPGKNAVASDGSPVVSGYATVMGTGVTTNRLRYFSVRTAEDVRKEGNFTIPNITAYKTGDASYTAGDAGRVAMNGTTTILNGSINAAALPGYDGGTVAFGGKNINVQSAAALLPASFAFATSIVDVDPKLDGTVQIASSSLSGKGLREISVGTLDTSNPANSTSTVTIAKGSALDAPVITLAAHDAVTLEDGVTVTSATERKYDKDGKLISASGGKVSIISQGQVSVAATAKVEVSAGGEVNLSANRIDLQGSLKGDKSQLNVTGNRLILGTDIAQADGLALTSGFFGSLSGFDSIGLKSGSDLSIRGNVNLGTAGTLSIDAARIVADAARPVTATFTAKNLEMINSGATAGAGSTSAAGSTVTLKADQAIIGNGDIRVDGFSITAIQAANDLTFRGKGSLSTGGDLNLSAARVTVASKVTPPATAAAAPAYQAANFLVNAGSGALNLKAGSGTAGQGTTVGGSLEMRARTIDVATTVDVPAGQLTITASGSAAGEGVVLEKGARLAATGHDYGSGETEPGGAVTLRADNGAVRIDSGATVDVSAGAGDAGSIVLAAGGQGVTINGTVSGASKGGRGGSISIDTNQVTDFAGLNSKIGGFTEGVAVRTRTGDLTVDNATTVKSRNVTLSAGSGSLALQGTIDASAASGGSVALNAGKDLTVSGTIDAHATDASASGSSVALNSEGGRLSLTAGSRVDVSGSGKGGSVDLRAQRTANDVAMDLNGTVKGASRVSVEAFTTHTASFIGAQEQSDWRNETTTYMANAGTIKDRLLAGLGMDGWSKEGFHFLPGIEVRSSGDLTVGSALDLTGWRDGGEAGNLTLRAAGNLNVNQSIVDHPTDFRSLPGTNGRNSWGINLVAGSDLKSSDVMATRLGTGNLTVDGSDTLVYTESAPLRFASGNDTILGAGSRSSYMVNTALAYTLGTYSGAISGTTGGNLRIKGGAIQSATGGIDLAVGGDLDLTSGVSLGSVRTTGAHPYVANTPYDTFGYNYWEYTGGGDISLTVAGAVKGNADPSYAWETFNNTGGGRKSSYYWSADFNSRNSDATRGLATMGGGSLLVKSGGDFTCQAGAFGAGNVQIYAGGDLDGRFLVRNGAGVLHAAGNFGDFSRTGSGGAVLPAREQLIEAFDTRLSVIAQGNAVIGTVDNPSLAGVRLWSPGNNPAYAPDTRLNVTAVTGDVALTGNNRFDLAAVTDWEEHVLPGTVALSAGRDIRVGHAFALAPSAQGNLSLTAGRDISGSYLDVDGKSLSALISMSDADPARFYTPDPKNPMVSDDFFDAQTHSNPGNQRDNTAITISAGRDLTDMKLYLPKQAIITASRDIRDINYRGQNLGANDLSQIKAGRDIFFSSAATGASTLTTGIDQGGAGSLLVQAGGNIDLGTSNGIKSSGNAYNQALGSKGGTLLVVAGTKQNLTPEQVSLFFNGSHRKVTKPDGTETEIVDKMGLRDYGIVYDHFKTSGQTDFANQVLAVEENAATEFFYGHPVVTWQKDGATPQPGGIVNGGNAISAAGTVAGTYSPQDLTIGKFFYPSAVVSAVMAAPQGITTADEHDSRLADRINDGTGNINMTSSQISTNSGNDDLYILSRSAVNVGKSTMILDRQLAAQKQKNTGIYTAKGGAIDIFSGGDLNVNESRVMTFYGGDITAWSDQGDINAGRGSKTTISTEPPRLVRSDPNHSNSPLILVFSPPAVGSGIRTLTYAAGLGDTAPPAGDGYVYAPRGNIDAGEAGIAVNNLFISARQVFNAINISALGSSSGLPASDSTVSIGALSGTGALAENDKMIEQSSSLGGGIGRSALDAAQTVDDFVAKWLDVKVISFDEE
jgi:filamentous hemagglutinin family protein